MPRPPSVSAARELVRRSGLVPDAALAAGPHPDDSPDAFLGRLVAGGLLTPFQAGQLAAGRWRGLVVGNYALSECLGTGGMGRVYLAVCRRTGRAVAVKVLSAALAEDATARARLAREARAAGTLDHPNVVRVTAVDLDHDPPYLVMEHARGQTLQALVARGGTFCAGAAALVGRQVALGLQHAWEHGVVHRDVKPANVLLDRDGAVKVVDFGIVRLTGEAANALTLAGSRRKVILGTVDYLAPEQADDSSKVDCRADVYALGATLYFLLAGHPPFPHGSPAARLARKQADDPPPLDRLRPDVPAGFAAAVARMMCRDPGRRFASPRRAADALEPWAIPVAGFPEDAFARAEAARAETPRPPGVAPRPADAVAGSSIHAYRDRPADSDEDEGDGDPTRPYLDPDDGGEPTACMAPRPTVPHLDMPAPPTPAPFAAFHGPGRPGRRPWARRTAVAVVAAAALLLAAGYAVWKVLG